MSIQSRPDGLPDLAATYWFPLARRLALPDSILEWLLAAYEEPHRRYHDLAHIHEMLECLEASVDLAENPDSVALAVWFHDSIYDSTLPFGENERLSADKLAEMHEGKGSAAAQAMIRHSACHEGSDDPDVRLFCDLDLYRLGVDYGTFRKHGADVRAEYAWVEEVEWMRKRNDFFRRFLERPVIYQTDYWRDRLEKRARENLARTIAETAG